MTAVKGLVVLGDGGKRAGRRVADVPPTALMPVANRPLLVYVCETLRAAGVVEIAVVVRHDAAGQVREAVGDGARWGVEFTCIDDEDPAGLAHAILLAEQFVDGHPFIVHSGASLLKGGIPPGLLCAPDGELDAVVMFERDGVPGAPQVPILGSDQPLELTKELIRGKGELALLDISYFGPKIFEAIRSLPPSWRGRLEIRDALVRLLDAGGRAEARMVDGCWTDHGQLEDLLEANRMMLEGVEPDYAGATLRDTRIQGRVAIDDSAVLESTTVRGPAVIGAGARLSHSYVGPYTAIGDNVRIEGAEIEHSIILDGAVIRHLGGRLEASVVGKNARVFRNFTLPRAFRLHVGAGAEVSLD